MSDLISRQAVLESLKTDYSLIMFDSYGNLTFTGERIIEAINRVPSVEPEQSQCSWYGEDGRCHFAEQEMDKCDDCISRTELLKKQQIIIDEHGLEHKIVYIGKIIDAPPVEPERKKGHWIIHSDDLFPSESTQECSKCHEHQPLDWRHSDNYCPNCGADMREVLNG